MSSSAINNNNILKINEYYILPCLQELKQFAIAGSFSEPEQTPGFFNGDKISEIPYDEFYKEWTGKRSTNDNYNYNNMKKEYTSMVISDFSKYGFNTVCKNIGLMKKWEIYTQFLCDKFGADNTNDNTNDNTKNVAFFITHHNRMKDITQGLLPMNKKFGYANNCCIKIQIDKADNNNISVSINVLFQGYPDKPDSNKTGGGSSYNYVHPNNPDNPDNFPLLHVEDIKTGITTGMTTGMISDIRNITIYVIRHGNSLHNKPSKTKEIDSSLTPLGMYQAIKLFEEIKNDVMDTKHVGAKVKFILCCSFLQRTQLTGLSIMKQLNALNDTTTTDLNKMETNAITRFIKKKLDIKIFNEFSPLNSKDDYQNFEIWYYINPYNKINRIGEGGKLNQMHITLKVKSHKRKYKRLTSKGKTKKRNRCHTKK